MTMTQEDQLKILQMFSSPQTTDKIQPNFEDVKTVADDITNVVAVANALTDQIFNDVTNNIADIKTIALQKDNISTLAAITTTLTSLVDDKTKLDSIYADKATLDGVFALKNKLDSIYADKVIIDSIYADKTKLDEIHANLSKINTTILNIDAINDASTHAQTATTKAQEASDSADEAKLAKEQAQSIAGGEILATNVKFSDLLMLDTWRTNTDNAITALNSILENPDTALDTLVEISNFIKANKSTLDTLGIGNIAGLQTALDQKAVINDAVASTTSTYSSSKVENIIANHSHNLKTINGNSIEGTGNVEIQGVPAGIISMWSGTIENIPNGWYLCDGNNGTPNLTDKFIMGANSNTEIGHTGGSADSVVVAHTHTGSTNTTGNHTHGIPKGSNWGQYGSGNYSAVSEDNAGGNHITSTAGNHSHTLTINQAGEDGKDKNLPPYYKLAYIMKG